MKKSLLILSLALAGAVSAAFGQGAGSAGTSNAMFSFNPSSQMVGSNSSFNVTLSLTAGSTPNPVEGYDLWLATGSGNSGLFTIDSVTYSKFTSYGNLGPGYNDALSNNSDISSGYVRNSNDLGNIATSTSNDLSSGQTAQIATIKITTGSLTPGQTYTFYTTTGTNSNPPTSGIATSYSHYSDSVATDSSVYTMPQASFTITAAGAAVPEPSTWFAGFAAAGVIGYSVLRRRSVA